MASSFLNELEERDIETLASLAEDIVFRLPGCTDLMIRKTIGSVYRDFCRRTCALVTKRKIGLKSGVACYGVAPFLRGGVVDCVRSVSTEDGREINTFVASDGTIVVEKSYLPVDGETKNIIVETVEIPGIGCEEAPRWFLDKYGDAIISGTLAKLMAMTGRAWSDAQMAAIENSNFNSALTEARVRSLGGGQSSAGKLNFIKKGNLL